MSNFLSTWIYLDNENESSEYAQVGKGSHLPEFHKVYWRCVAVFYALAHRFHPQEQLILFTNQKEENLPEIDGLDLKVFLKNRNVRVETLPLTWQTPPGYFGKWRNQFYIFDILLFVEKNYGAAENNFVVLDSDCIFTKQASELFPKIRECGLLVLPMPYDEDYDINGVTRNDMSLIFSDLDGNNVPEKLPIYYGGEVFAATLSVIREINKMAPRIWTEMQRRFKTGEKKLNEEAHFLSFCYYKIAQFGLLDTQIKRIWTSSKYNNVQAADADLPIWHLPSEKTGGIALLFKKLVKANQNPSSENQNLEDLTKEDLGKYLGVPKRTKWLNLRHFLKYLLKR